MEEGCKIHTRGYRMKMCCSYQGLLNTILATDRRTCLDGQTFKDRQTVGFTSQSISKSICKS